MNRFKRFCIAVGLCCLIIGVGGHAAQVSLAQEPFTCEDMLGRTQQAIDDGYFHVALQSSFFAGQVCQGDADAQNEIASLSAAAADGLVQTSMDDLEPGMVDLGDYQLFMQCMGEGDPTIILEGGLGGTYLDWQIVLPMLAEENRVCTVNRLGNEPSDPATEPRTTQDQVDDLITVLEIAEIEGPYILVAHSIGTYNALLFADQHPDDVLGMVLVDGSHPDQWERYAEVTDQFPAPSVAGSEMLDVPTSTEQVTDLDDLGDLPLVVITAQLTILFDEYGIDVELQAAHAARSTNSQQITAENSHHYIMYTEPNVILDAVTWIMDEIAAENE